ncbi:amidohydrolase [Chryseolinea lacunae]|uniref:Amidohydrolase n=1 Tax=Chryseolinea lacunae TaxID=2801331 RepID=A0ABS1KW18_9BACT|nr:amidohydrolase [Chryseolinea lacunae]MBL0742506.1 amidohydrolase [Chryseolinea lacunae]
MKSFFLLPALAALLFSCAQHPAADKVFLGRTWTANATKPWAEGVAIVSDTLVAVGTEEEIRKWIGKNTEVTTLPKGQLLTPGFIDCHTHFIDGGFALSAVQLRDAKSPAEFIQRIKAYAQTLPPGAWITAGDWDHENWGGELPTRAWVDSVTMDHPLWINRLDGHMCLANSAALKAANIPDNVKDVAGGTIVRDKQGKLTGIFKDNAMNMLYKVVPPPTTDQEDKALATAMAYVAARGVTSVHNMSGFQEVFERAHDAGKLTTRIYAGMMLSDWRQLNEKVKQKGHGDAWLRIGGLKEFVDGSLGSHTAAFFKPFNDTPKDSGFFVIAQADLHRRIKSADSAGLQVMVHAIGDKAINTLLNTFATIEKENGVRDRRFRIEHAQHIAPADIKRFAEQHIIASMQPYHAIDDGRWAEKVIGHERSMTTYAFRSLLDAGATLAFGSDWFVAPPTPLEGIYAAVTRRTRDDKNEGGWIPEQKISVEEALKAYTISAAYASFEENIKGSLEPGKVADMVLLEEDITVVAPPHIKDVNVLMTMVGGKVVYTK